MRFPVVDHDFDLLVWTTTPWTLVSNVAAAVGPDVEYVRVRVGDGRDLVLAAARVTEVLGDDVEVVGPIAVDELVGLHYERPFDFLPLDTALAARVVADEFVTIDDGSGIVHLAPAFGEIDREVAEREGLPMLNPVGPEAAFVDTPYRGQFVKDADPALDRRARRGRAPRARRRLRALVPALLALRHAAHLLGEANVVRAHVRAQGGDAPRERDDRMASRVHQARPVR